MDVTECPVCFEPLTGITCGNCGADTTVISTVYCDGCGREVAEKKASEVRYQKPISAQWVTEYYCPECD